MLFVNCQRKAYCKGQNLATVAVERKPNSLDNNVKSKMASSTSSKSELQRFSLIEKLISHALNQSREALSTEELVDRAYGEDAAVFGGKEMLVGTMEDMLDRLREEVDENFAQYLKKTGLEGFFADLEGRLAKLQQADDAAREAETRDQNQAQEAIEASSLPTGVSLEDVVAYNKYQSGLQQKKALQKRLEEAQAEIAALEQEEQEAAQILAEKQKSLETLSSSMTRSADICSMVAR